MSIHDLPGRQGHERGLELAAMAVDFELTRAESAELEAHLASCPTCARRAAAMRGDAVALGRPLTLLPSSRVDAAIAAEIAGRRAGPQRLVLVAAAAMLALALLGAAAVGAYLLRNVTTPPITDVTPITPPTVIVSPRPDASPVVIGDTWGTIDFAPGSGGSIEAVSLSGTDLIGVGGGECIPAGGPPTQCYAGAWTAALGEPWVRVPDQPDLEIGAAVGTSAPPARIIDVATGPGSTMAIGYADDGRARVWRTTDGQAWQLSGLEPGSAGETARVGAVLASPDGFLVVGWVVADNQESARAAVWSTTDGIDWTRSPDTAEMDVGPCFIAGDDLSCGGMLGVVRTPSGFVAVGSTHAGLSGTEPSRPTAWTSPDGLTWTQSRSGLDFVGLLSDVAAGGPGLVAVGTTCPPGCFEPTAGAVAATSVDGVTWAYTKVAGATGPQRVASIGQRVFAIGFLNADVEPFGDLQVWQTDDGVTWQRMTGIPSTTDRFGGADIAASNGRLVIVGWQTVSGVDGARNFAYVNPPIAAASVTLPPWTTREFVGGAPRGSVLAVSPTTSGFVAVAGSICEPPDTEPSTCQASIWNASADGAWSRVPDQPSLDVSLTGPFSGSDPGAFDVAAGPDGMVAIGNALDPAASVPAVSSIVGAAVWWSSDGRTWRRVDIGTSPADAHLAGIAADARGYVIVGWVDDYRESPNDIHGRAAAWTSTDGVSWVRAADSAAMDIGPCWDGGETAFCGGMHGVAAYAGGFVAVGHVRTAESSSGRPRPAAWTSPDGVTWTRDTGGLDSAESDAFLTGVTAGGFGVVAVGTSCPSTCNQTPIYSNAGAGFAAESADGSTWRIEPVAGAVGLREVVSVVISDETRKVFALGRGSDPSDTSAFPPDVLELWFSPAPGDWERAELPSIGGGYAVFGGADIATGSDMLMLVGGINQYVEGAPSDVQAQGTGGFSYSSH